jgi:hypothetical protein
MTTWEIFWTVTGVFLFILGGVSYWVVSKKLKDEKDI